MVGVGVRLRVCALKVLGKPPKVSNLLLGFLSAPHEGRRSEMGKRWGAKGLKGNIHSQVHFLTYSPPGIALLGGGLAAGTPGGT